MDNQIKDNRAIGDFGGGGIDLAESNATLIHNL
jgi:hypothetical protein